MRFSHLLINTLRFISLSLRHWLQLKLLRCQAMMRRQLFLLIICILEMLKLISRKVVLVEDVCIFNDIVEVRFQIQLLYFSFFLAQSVLFGFLCLVEQEAVEWHFALVLETQLEPQYAHHLARRTNSFHPLQNVCQFLLLSICQQNGHFSIKSFVQSASHEFHILVVLCFQHFALIVQLDEESLSLENVLVNGFLGRRGEIELAGRLLQVVSGRFFYFFGADSGEWVVVHLIKLELPVKQLLVLFQLHLLLLSGSFLVLLQQYQMSQQTVFVREYYQKDTHFNPVTTKIKPNVLKKSQEPAIHTLNHHIEHTNQLSAAKTVSLKPQTASQKFNFARSGSPMHSQQIRNRKPSRSEVDQVDDFSHIVQSERTFLMERNKQLQSELRDRDSRLTVLGRRCEQLQMQLMAVSSNSLDNSSSWSQMCNFPKSTRSSVVSDRSNNLQQLKSIRERLQKIDFSRFFSATNRAAHKNQ